MRKAFTGSWEYSLIINKALTTTAFRRLNFRCSKLVHTKYVTKIKRLRIENVTSFYFILWIIKFIFQQTQCLFLSGGINERLWSFWWKAILNLMKGTSEQVANLQISSR